MRPSVDPLLDRLAAKLVGTRALIERRIRRSVVGGDGLAQDLLDLRRYSLERLIVRSDQRVDGGQHVRVGVRPLLAGRFEHLGDEPAIVKLIEDRGLRGVGLRNARELRRDRRHRLRIIGCFDPLVGFVDVHGTRCVLGHARLQSDRVRAARRRYVAARLAERAEDTAAALRQIVEEARHLTVRPGGLAVRVGTNEQVLDCWNLRRVARGELTALDQLIQSALQSQTVDRGLRHVGQHRDRIAGPQHVQQIPQAVEAGLARRSRLSFKVLLDHIHRLGLEVADRIARAFAREGTIDVARDHVLEREQALEVVRLQRGLARTRAPHAGIDGRFQRRLRQFRNHCPRHALGLRVRGKERAAQRSEQSPATQIERRRNHQKTRLGLRTDPRLRHLADEQFGARPHGVRRHRRHDRRRGRCCVHRRGRPMLGWRRRWRGRFGNGTVWTDQHAAFPSATERRGASPAPSMLDAKSQAAQGGSRVRLLVVATG